MLHLKKRGANLEIESSEGDTLYAGECKAMDEFAKAQQHQDRLPRRTEEFPREP